MNLNIPVIDLVTSRPIFEFRQDVDKEGNPIQIAYPLIIADCIANAIQSGGDQASMPISTKMKRLELVTRIVLNKREVELSEEDIKIIKEVVSSFYKIAVMGPILKYFEEV
jgi:hypothetical protein